MWFASVDRSHDADRLRLAYIWEDSFSLIISLPSTKIFLSRTMSTGHDTPLLGFVEQNLVKNVWHTMKTAICRWLSEPFCAMVVAEWLEADDWKLVPLRLGECIYSYSTFALQRTGWIRTCEDFLRSRQFFSKAGELVWCSILFSKQKDDKLMFYILFWPLER